MAGAIARGRGHAPAFNTAFATGDWTGFADRFDRSRRQGDAARAGEGRCGL